MNDLTTSLDKILSNAHKNIILGGDFNFPGIDWVNKQVKPQSPYADLHQDFIDLTKTFSLSQLVREPTRVSNVLDLLLTNIPERINFTKVLPGISDHQIPLTEMSLCVNRRRQAERKIPLYRRADWIGLNDYLESIIAPLYTSSASVEDIWQQLKSALHEASEKYIPSKTTKARPSKPWISEQLSDKIKLRDRLYDKSKKTGRVKIEERYIKYKRIVQRELRQEHRSHVEDILTDDRSTSSTNKRFRNYVKHRRSDNSGIGTLRVGGRLITDPSEKAEALNQQFRSVFNKNPSHQYSDSPNNNSKMPHIKVAVDGVYAQLRKLNQHKATGPDQLSPRLLRETAGTIAPALCNLFQLSLDRAEVSRD